MDDDNRGLGPIIVPLLAAFLFTLLMIALGVFELE